MEESGDAIVIRFPPVTQTPLDDVGAGDGAPRESRAADEPQATSSESVSEPQPETATESPTTESPEADASRTEDDQKTRRGARRGRRGRRGKSPRPTPEPVETEESAPETPALDVRPEPADEEMKKLSPSQKRRLRRKRRARETADGSTPAADQAVAVEPKDADDESAKPARRGRRRKPKPTTATESDEAASALATAEPEKKATTKPVADGPRGTEMVINIVPNEECRIAIIENGKLEEIYLERASAENHVGNIYKGIVTNVEASIQAAFINFGMQKNGFLHISDLHPQYFPNGAGQTENVGKKIPRRNRPPIQRCLRRGQEVMVQLTKEGIGTKGPTLSTYMSIPGRFLVMMPGMQRLGVSRKIEDDDARYKLRNQLSELELPDGIGFIARTAAQERTKRELQSDLNYLLRLWKAVDQRNKKNSAPAELYTESDLVIRTIRDVFTSDIDRIVVDDAEVAQRARDFLAIFSPRSRDTVEEYTDPLPIFHKYDIEAELERLHSRHVPLKSGGSIVIDQTEALVAIDVNSGRFRSESDAETTAFKINLEAADEIARQLRLRDLGGVVVCDFIDMRMEKHRREVERCLARNLKQHKERAKVLRTSQFGIIELTRQRQRAGLTRAVYQDCKDCRGTGLVKTAESVVLDIMRLVQLAVTHEHIASIEVSVSQEVAHVLLNRKRALLHELERKNNRTIAIAAQSGYGLDQIQIRCFDARGRQVPHN